jgi:hypothetical protein
LGFTRQNINIRDIFPDIYGFSEEKIKNLPTNKEFSMKKLLIKSDNVDLI